VLKKVAPLTLVALALVAGCNSTSSEDADQPNAVLHSVTRHEYKGIAELKKDSTLVVRVSASTSKGREINSIPFTATEVIVREVLHGQTAKGARLSVLQMGSEQTDSPDTSKLLARGQEYVLFLMDYHLTPGDDTGLKIIVGEQGIYRLDSEAGRYVFASGSHSGLPNALRSADIASLRSAR
jgi:hypothetical protein